MFSRLSKSKHQYLCWKVYSSKRQQKTSLWVWIHRLSRRHRRLISVIYLKRLLGNQSLLILLKDSLKSKDPNSGAQEGNLRGLERRLTSVKIQVQRTKLIVLIPPKDKHQQNRRRIRLWPKERQDNRDIPLCKHWKTSTSMPNQRKPSPAKQHFKTLLLGRYSASLMTCSLSKPLGMTKAKRSCWLIYWVGRRWIWRYWIMKPNGVLLARKTSLHSWGTVSLVSLKFCRNCRYTAR